MPTACNDHPVRGELAEAPPSASRFGAGLHGAGSRLTAFLLACCCLVLALDLLLLERIPYSATLDDGVYAEWSFSFVQTGRTGWPMMRGLFGLERDSVSSGRAAAAAVGLSQMVLGTTSFAARLPGLLAVVLSVALVFILARQCSFSVPVSLAGSLVWFLSVPARGLAHSARPDSMLMLFALMTATLLFRALARDSRRLVILSGLAAGLSLEAHMAGSCIIVTFVACAFLLSARTKKLANTGLFCLGVAPALILWLWIHKFSQPDLWRLQWDGFWRYWAPSPMLSGPSAIARSVLARYGGYFWGARYHRFLIEAPFILTALIAALHKKNPGYPLALAFLTFHLSLAVFASGPHAGYMAAVYPLACVPIAATFLDSSRRIRFLGGAALVAFYLLQTAYWAVNNQKPLPERLHGDVLRTVGDRPFLIGDHLWFHFSRNDNARSIVAVNLAALYTPAQPWPYGFRKYLVDQGIAFVVLDRVADNLLTAEQRTFFSQTSVLVQEYDYGEGRWVKIYELSGHESRSTPHD